MTFGRIYIIPGFDVEPLSIVAPGGDVEKNRVFNINMVNMMCRTKNNPIEIISVFTIYIPVKHITYMSKRKIIISIGKHSLGLNRGFIMSYKGELEARIEGRLF